MGPGPPLQPQAGPCGSQLEALEQILSPFMYYFPDAAYRPGTVLGPEAGAANRPRTASQCLPTTFALHSSIISQLFDFGKKTSLSFSLIIYKILHGLE